VEGASPAGLVIGAAGEAVDGAKGAEGMVVGMSPAVLVVTVIGAAVGDAEEADGMVGGASRDRLLLWWCGRIRTIFIRAGGTSTGHALRRYEAPLSDLNVHKLLMLI
jgi:hypothetical protein